MNDEPKEPSVTDPDNVPETFCNGGFNVEVSGPFATITFTHARPDADLLFREEKIIRKSVVRARIVISSDNLRPLRDVLTHLLEDTTVPLATAGGTRH